MDKEEEQAIGIGWAAHAVAWATFGCLIERKVLSPDDGRLILQRAFELIAATGDDRRGKEVADRAIFLMTQELNREWPPSQS